MVAASFVVNALAGLLAVLSLVLPWKLQGNGSTFSAARLASTLSSGPTAIPGGRLVFAFVYGVAIVGCILLALSGVGTRWAAVVRVSLGLVLLAGIVTCAVTGWLPLEQWSHGPRLVAASGFLAAIPALIKGATR